MRSHFTRVAPAFLAGAAVFAAPQPTTRGPSPEDYRQWRGERRDGAASGFIEPPAWPQTLTHRWTVEVGEGYATPLVLGDTVFVFSRRDGSETLAALNSLTGSQRWESSYAAPYQASEPAKTHGAGPKATPVYADGKLFTAGIAGVVSAFDAGSGRRLWQTQPPDEHPFFGAASSPLVENGLVIVHPGNYEPLTAFDQTSGEIRWRAGGEGFFASPIAVDIGGTRQIVSATLDSIIGVSLDGVVLWRHAWNGGGGSVTPVLSGDTIIVSALDAGVRAVQPRKQNGGWRVDTLWTRSDVSMYLSTPVVADQTVFGFSHKGSGRFFALDAKSGEVLWQGSPREAENAAVVKGGRVVFFLKDNAELVVARANRTRFEPLARYTVAQRATWADPVISGRRLFVRHGSALALWEIFDVWREPAKLRDEQSAGR
jgi:outer membrane protein assembly factor BamB